MKARRRKKVLIIEDETALLYALQAQLKVEGYEVESAVDGAKALDVLKHFRPDLIVLDILLPKVDGFEVLSRIRTNARLVDTPVIIITNLTDKQTREKGLELGAKEFIAKADYNLQELADKIRKALKD